MTANTTMARAVAASSAVPGDLRRPSSIGDRRCMDGGVSGTGTHLDLLAGARRVLILALTDGSDMTEGMMTSHPVQGRQELEDLEASGTEVVLRTPSEVDLLELMAPTSRSRKALALGRTPGIGRRRASCPPSGADSGPVGRSPSAGRVVRSAGGVTEAATASDQSADGQVVGHGDGVDDGHRRRRAVADHTDAVHAEQHGPAGVLGVEGGGQREQVGVEGVGGLGYLGTARGSRSGPRSGTAASPPAS